MWDNLLIISSADNGGPVYQGGGSNNFPKRGGKMSNFQGGINVNAYASGGFLPAAVQGTTLEKFIHISDIYATFCELAGVDPTDARAAAAGLPPIDSLSMWDLLSGANTTSPRTEIVSGDPMGNVTSLIQVDGWKLMIGSNTQDFWQGPSYPNKTSTWPTPVLDCGDTGCLFNIIDDPTEHKDLASSNPKKAAELRDRITYWQTQVYYPDRGTVDPAACAAGLARGGFWGPWIE